MGENMASNNIRWNRIPNGKFRCLLCTKQLSSKQRVMEHLHNIHFTSPLKKEKKKYLVDSSVPVPRSTQYRWKKQNRLTEASSKMSLVNYQQCANSEKEHTPVTSMIPPDVQSAQCDSVLSTPKKQLIFNNPDSYRSLESCNTSLEECEMTSPPPVHQDLNETMPFDNFSFDVDDCSSSPLSADIYSENCHSHINTSFENTGSDNLSGSSLSDSEIESYPSFSSSSEDTGEDTISSSESVMDTDINVNSDIPVKEFQSLSLLSCFLRNHLSLSSSQDVMQTIKETFKDCEDIARLDFNDMMTYAGTTPPIELHYCVLCNEIFPENADIFMCSSINCDGLRYKGNLSRQQMKSRQPKQSFVFADVKSQLVDLLQTPGIWKEIVDSKQAAYERLESGDNTLHDITDGRKYREMMNTGGFLEKGLTNITGIFNTDGVNLYASSKVELWPIFLAINELVPSSRFSRDNILLVGVWQGKGKPPFEAFFKIFSERMNSLYNDGVQIKVDEDNINVKFAVLCGVFDLPAKAEVLNMSYFNGPFACIKCEQTSMTVKQGKGIAKCFPYKLPGARCPDRKHETVLVNMRTGSAQKRSKGFKGMSGLANLKGFNLVLGVVPEYMHGVLLGVTKTLLNMWFSPSHSSKDYFIGKDLKVISQKMKNIKPPYGIERLPRDLEKHYNHFKATELQSWLLFYAYPCVQGFLKEEYLENLVCLSEGIHILLRDRISPELLATAADLLDQFYASFQHLYSDGSCGLNIHNTGQHLVEYVRLWGPLWCWSCFPFEDSNAKILQAVHGTGIVAKQVMRYRQAQASIRRRGLIKKTTLGWKIKYKAINCDIAGALKEVKKDELKKEILEQLAMLHHIEEFDNLKTFDRIIVNGRRFYSDQYTRMQRRLCSIVLFCNGSVGRVKYFILCEDCAYGVVMKIDKIPLCQLEIRVSSHFIPVRQTDTLNLVSVEQMQEVMIMLQPGGSETEPMYVTTMPNSYGHAVFK